MKMKHLTNGKAIWGIMVFLIVLCLCLSAFGATIITNGYCGGEGDGSNLTWTLYDNGLLKISGTGDMEDFSWHGAPWYDYHEDIRKIQFESGVSSIGEYAFVECDNLTEIDFTTTIKHIKTCGIGWCGNIKSLVLPEGLESIEESSIYYCNALETVSIPASLTSMDGSIGICPSLKRITVSENNTSFVVIDGVLFNYNKTELICHPAALAETYYNIPDTVTIIGVYAFDWCSNLKKITIPDSVKEIKGCAFSDCNSLTSVDIPDSVTKIEQLAFFGCSSMKSVKLSNNLKRLWAQAFSDCTSLTEVFLPRGFERIDDNRVFRCCPNLVKIFIPDSVVYIASYTFEESPNVTIYGRANSYAQTFAEENGIPFVVEENKFVSSIIMDHTKATLTRTSDNKKPTLQLTATVEPEDATDPSVEWTSSNPKVAKVDENGKVTALKKGTAVITCAAKDGSGVKAECKITVKDKLISKLTLNKKKVTIKKGKTFQLKVTKLSPANAFNQKVTWKSSNTKIATVDKNGKVKAKKKGTCIITCTAKDSSGKKVTCKVTVK